MNDYFNKKRFHNIVMQIVCDVNKRFWNVCVNRPSKTKDGWQVVRKHNFLLGSNSLAKPWWLA
jgi:hypothetical protein